VKGGDFRDYGRYGTVGIELIISMAIGYYGGRYLDARIGGHGWVTFVGFLLGVILGFRAIFAAGRHLQRDAERAERADRGEDPWQDDGASQGTHHDDGKPEP
jgi:ATP synthase protein I